jgi:hypothetical protein
MDIGQRFTGQIVDLAITELTSAAAVKRSTASGLVLSFRQMKRGVLSAARPKYAIAPGACDNRVAPPRLAVLPISAELIRPRSQSGVGWRSAVTARVAVSALVGRWRKDGAFVRGVQSRAGHGIIQNAYAGRDQML